MKINKSILLFIFVTLLIFCIVYPISNKINFAQNDDWIYYRTISDFQKGEFLINPYIEATFYTQGLLALTFTKFFPLIKLPILTLVISLLNFLILTITVNKFYLKNKFKALIVGLIFLLNPLSVYSTFGFMTDNYFMFFLITSIYFYEEFRSTNKLKNLIWFNISMIVGFFVRQLSIISGVALVIWLLFNKKYKQALTQTAYTLGILVYYFCFYPKTANMKYNQDFALINLIHLDTLYNFLYAFLIYIFAFLLPLSLWFVPNILKLPKKNLIIATMLIVGIVVVTSVLFKSSDLPNPDFYYFKNVLSKNGFFYGSTLGDKYNLKVDFYKVWDYAARFGMATILVGLIFKKQRVINYYFIFGVLYLGLMCIMLSFYDRYILVMIPITIFALLNYAEPPNKASFVISGIFILVLGFYLYNMTMDFVVLNNKMWTISNKLVSDRGVKNTAIAAGYGWRRLYNNPTLRYKYMFYFGNIKSNPDIYCCYNLEKVETIDFPLNMFENSKVYLYKRRF